MEDLDTPKSKAFESLRILLILVVLVLALVLWVSRDFDQIRLFILRAGWLGAFICIMLYPLLGVSPVPSEPLTVLSTTIYGPLIAMLIAGLGNLLAAMIEYYVGARLSDVANFEKHRHRLPFHLGNLPVDSWVFLIAARMLPGYGSKFVSVLAGVYKVRWWRYTWTTAVSTFLGAAMFAYGGFELLRLIFPR